MLRSVAALFIILVGAGGWASSAAPADGLCRGHFATVVASLFSDYTGTFSYRAR